MNMIKWKTFSDPNLSLQFKYPDPTPQGSSVRKNVIDSDQSYRVHLTARDFQESNDPEIYFEIGCYDGVTPERVYQKLTESQKANTPEVSVSNLNKIDLASWSGFQFSMHWPEKERVVIIIPVRDSVYRIIYDPTSELNKLMLSTMTFNFEK